MQHQLSHVLQSKARGNRAMCGLVSACLALLGCDAGSAEAHAEGLLSVVLPRDIQQLDPRFVSDAYGHKLSRLVFASLLRIDPQTLEPVPDLAERVEIVSDLEYRAHLRPDLRFSDGSRLDATDVVATYRSIVD